MTDRDEILKYTIRLDDCVLIGDDTFDGPDGEPIPTGRKRFFRLNDGAVEEIYDWPQWPPGGDHD